MSDRIQPTRATTAPLGVDRATAQAGGATRNAARERGQETYRMLADSVQANREADAVAEATGSVKELQRQEQLKALNAKAAETKDKAASEPSKPTLEGAARRINDFLQRLGRKFILDHSFDKEANQNVVTVKDSSSGDVIRQIPPEETLRIARSIGYYQSALVNLQA